MEDLLITAVYNRKAIWDPADELRKNSQVLKSLWAEVAKEINVEVSVAKNRWKNLRAYYASQLREMDKPRSGTGGGVKTNCTWAFYDRLSFLKDICRASYDTKEGLLSTKVSDISNQSQAEETYDELLVDNSLLSSVLDIKTENDVDVDTISASTIADKPVASPNQTEIFKEKSPPKNDDNSDYSVRRANINKQKRHATTERFTENRVGEILDIERRKVQLLEREITAEDNPDLLFFKSLLPYMQEFTTIQKLRIRSTIQSLILSEHESMQHDSVQSGTSPEIKQEYHLHQHDTSSTPSPAPQSAYEFL